jgi:hypothetical protein
MAKQFMLYLATILITLLLAAPRCRSSYFNTEVRPRMVSGEAAVVIISALTVPYHDPPEENIDRPV